MGLGDNLMATGMAKGAAKRGKRIAFGDGKRIIWDHNSEEVFRGNPNIAPPGHEGNPDVEWVPFYRGNRIYNTYDMARRRWIWNYDFRSRPGELYFSDDELSWAEDIGRDFVVIEPCVPTWKNGWQNKQWPQGRFDVVAEVLTSAGHDVVQLAHREKFRLGHGRTVDCPNFRYAAAALARAKLALLPEGGLHHAAAAVGTPAVVLFGSFIPTQVTGYDGHINLAAGDMACGSVYACPHCEKAMKEISVERVVGAIGELLNGGLSRVA